MPEDHVDQTIKLLANDYFRRLEVAKAKCKDAMWAGTVAQNEWLTDISSRGGTRIKAEPRTGVDSGGGGMSCYDVLFSLSGMDIYVEVQASEYNVGHKPIQAQGQVLGFAHVSAGVGVPARYYKIFGKPRKICRWSRRETQKALTKADYEPQFEFSY
jgi:hypothetical protein